MLSLIRHFQKQVLIVITAVIVVSFAFLYSDLDFTARSLGTKKCFLEVGGHCYRDEEALKLGRLQDLAFQLGLTEFANQLRGPGRMDYDPTDFVLNLLVMRQEAKKLGIEPTDEQVKQAISKIPVLQSPSIDKQMIRNFLGQSGMDEADLYQLARDHFCYTRIVELLGAGIEAVPSDLENTYVFFNQKYTASLVRFNVADYLNKASVTEEEIKKYFDDRNGEKPAERQRQLETPENPKALEPAPATPMLEPILTDELRGFDYVKFTPTPPSENATAEEKAKAGVTFAKEVNRLYSELSDNDKDFVQIAKKQVSASLSFKVESGSIEPFARGKAPELFKDAAAALREAFSGTLILGEVSAPIENADGSVFVLKFSKRIEPRPMTLDEARPTIEKALQIKKANQLASDAANVALPKLKEALNAGKSMAEAAASADLKSVDVPAFSVTEPPLGIEEGQALVQAVRSLSPGELSGVTTLPDGKGYFIAHLQKTEIFKDEQKASQLSALAAQLELREKSSLFLAWLAQRGRESGARRNDSIQNVALRLRHASR